MTQIEYLEKAIEIQEAIEHFKRLIRSKNDSINGFAGTFPELRKKYFDNIHTYNRCIIRLEERFEKLLKEVKK